jgi:putative copper resistance protein D
MPGGLYYTVVTIHVLAALVWLGGMFFFALVGAPALRRIEPASLRADLFRRLGEAFLPVAWTCIAVLVVTGLINLHLRGLLDTYVLGDAAFWRSRFGTALAWKLGAVAVMVGVGAFHDFVLGPRASRLDAGTPTAMHARRTAAWLARINALAGVVLVIAAVRLARGG